MVDSLTPDDLQRIEDNIKPSKLNTEKQLKAKLRQTRDNKLIYPKKLQDFLFNRYKSGLMSSEERSRIGRILADRNKKLSREDVVTKGVWNGKASFYVRSSSGKFKTWGIDPVRKVDFDTEIRLRQEEIRLHQQKIARINEKIEKLKKQKEEKAK